MNTNNQSDSWYPEAAQVRKDDDTPSDAIAACELRMFQARKDLKKVQRWLADCQIRVSDLQLQLCTKRAFGMDKGEIKIAIKETEAVIDHIKKNVMVRHELLLEQAIYDYKLAFLWRHPELEGKKDEEEEEFVSKRAPK